jgi:RHS repeat-associated protein
VPFSTDPNLYTLLLPDGSSVVFRKNGTAPDITYVLQGVTDANGQFFAYTVDSRNRIIKVTEPGGRWIQMSHSCVGSFNIAYVNLNYPNSAGINSVSIAGTFNNWDTQANPCTLINNVWTVTVPMPIGSHQYKFVINGNNWQPDPYNPNHFPAGAGNNSVYDVYVADVGTTTGAPQRVTFSYTNASASSVYVVGSFNGWNSTATPMVKDANGVWTAGLDLAQSVYQYKLLVNGSQWIQDPGNPLRAPDGYGGWNSTLSVGPNDQAITQVTTSDGRSAQYSYTMWNVGGAIFSMLTNVLYDDGTKAIYTYNQPFSGGRPLLATAQDPRYVGPMQNIAYEYQFVSGVEGYILKEKSLSTGTSVFALTGQPNWRQLQNGALWGGTADITVAQVTHRVSGVGASRSYVYDQSGYGFLISKTDELGGVTSYQRNPNFGAITTQTLPDGSTQTATYTDNNKPFYKTSETDQLGDTTSYTRDANGRIILKTYPDASTEAFTYNAAGQVLTHRLRNGATESFAYNARGLKTSWIDAAGNVTNYAYDSLDRLASVTDALNHTTSFTYTSRDQILRTTYADGSYVEFTYDSYGHVLTKKNELGKVWTYAYDEFGRVLTATDPIGRKTTYGYSIGGSSGCGSCSVDNKPTSIVTPSGQITLIGYDAEFRKISETVGAGGSDAATTTYAYDNAGNMISKTDALGHTTTFAYDILGRQTSQTDALGNVTRRAYDAAGNITSVTLSDNTMTTNTYDAMNRLTKTVDAAGGTTTYGYDSAGNMVQMTDAKGNSYTWTYDTLNRKTKFTYPDGSFEAYAYDAAGNQTSISTRKGAVLTTAYDARNRPTIGTWSDGTTGFSRGYDSAGRLLTLTNPNATIAYAYDDAGQLLSETTTISGQAARMVSSQYDADGRRTQVTYPSGSVVAYTYTGRGQIAGITADGPPPVANYTYDIAGRRIQKTIENGVVTTYAYDNANRLTNLAHAGTACSQSVSYALNALGNRTVRTEAVNGVASTDNYTYDATQQVTNAAYAGGRTQGFGYDLVGNRTSVSEGGTNTTYTANALNQYSSVGAAAQTYDANGNLTVDTENGTVKTLSYDAQNRLLNASVGANSMTVAYDARNRVVKRVINGAATYFYYDGWNLIEERDASGNLKLKYVNGPGVDEKLMLTRTTTPTPIFYHEDGLGSVIALTDMTGNVLERYKYDVFGLPAILDGSGQPIAQSAYGNRFLFTGREWIAETGLYDYRNRMYSPSLGRFMQTDPIKFSAGDGNIYRYVANDPVNSIDPKGLATKEFTKKDGVSDFADLLSHLGDHLSNGWKNLLNGTFDFSAAGSPSARVTFTCFLFRPKLERSTPRSIHLPPPRLPRQL